MAIVRSRDLSFFHNGIWRGCPDAERKMPRKTAGTGENLLLCSPVPRHVSGEKIPVEEIKRDGGGDRSVGPAGINASRSAFKAVPSAPCPCFHVIHPAPAAVELFFRRRILNFENKPQQFFVDRFEFLTDCREKHCIGFLIDSRSRCCNCRSCLWRTLPRYRARRRRRSWPLPAWRCRCRRGSYAAVPR